MSGKRPIVEYGVVVSRKQGLTAMTAAERQAVRQVARRAALLEAAQFLLDVSQRPGTVIKVAGILQLEAARLRALADEPAAKCGTCGGRGWIPAPDEPADCPDCAEVKP